MRKLLLPFAVFALLVVSHAAPRPRLPLESFFAAETIRAPALSPTGRYLAWLQPVNRRFNLVVLDREKNVKTRLTDMKEDSVELFYWAKPDRIVFYQQFRGQERAGLYAVNADGTQLSILHQLSKLDADGEVETEGDARGFAIIDQLPADPRRILVDFIRGASGLGDPHYLDIYTGKLTKAMNNLGKIRGWMTDRHGVIRLALDNDEKAETTVVYYRAAENKPWVEIERFPADGPTWTPLGFDGDDRTLFIRSDRGRETDAVYAYDPETKKNLRELEGDDEYDAGDIIYSQHRQKVIGVEIEREKPEIVWLDEADRRLAADIDGALPGTRNTIISRTADESLVVIRAASDRDAGTYYLLDVSKLELKRLAAANDRLDPKQMAQVSPITFPARDGLKLHGYLTIPVGREPKDLPLIVHPHGGPFTIRDSWGFDPEVQLLANRGYAVLQINFRGSGGYGHAFEEAGYRQWGLKMQDDLTDGVRWAVAQGVADPKRVAIYGASYGGYATLAGLTMTPDLYVCGINYVGVSDLLRLSILADFSRFPKPTQDYYARRFCHPKKDAAQLKATSPVNLIQNLRVPLLMAYGVYDPRVTSDQFKVLEDALKKYQKPYKNIVVANEGHGFHKVENALKFYAAVDAFLDEHMPGDTVNDRVEVGPLKTVDLPAKKSE